MKSVWLLSSLAIIATFFTEMQGQRITTIQLDGVQYFVSRMNPYSPELNFYLAYQYCRSLGLQLASFETKEKADSITQYLRNAGYTKYDFWTSGNKLGTDMFLWMSTGLPFNATFNYMKKPINELTSGNSDNVYDIPTGSTAPQRTARENGDSGSKDGCVSLRAPTLEWDTDDCTSIKDFICEQTRCYYYNYGSIPVSSTQGKPQIYTTTIHPSSTESINKLDNVGINNFINKLRSTAGPPQVLVSNSEYTNPNSENDNGTPEPEAITNGPYNSDHSNSELQDEPAVTNVQNHDEDYVSTIEPDIVTHVFAKIKSPYSY